jgi:hypothetical protein
MSYIKKAIEEIQERGWPVTDESIKRLEETIRNKHGKNFHDWIDNKNDKDGKDGKVHIDGKVC